MRLNTGKVIVVRHRRRLSWLSNPPGRQNKTKPKTDLNNIDELLKGRLWVH